MDTNTIFTNQENASLDDIRRVKAVSPRMLIAKRFFRNRLAIIGIVILVILFSFCFIGAWVYKYNQDEIFLTTKDMYFDYAVALINTTFDRVYYFVDEGDIDENISASVNSHIINDMIPNGLSTLTIDCGAVEYVIDMVNDDIYTLSVIDATSIKKKLLVQTKNVLHFYSNTLEMSNEFMATVMLGLGTNENFTFDGNEYIIDTTDYATIYKKSGDTKEPVLEVSNFVAKRYNGEDSLSLDVKKQMQNVIDDMAKSSQNQGNYQMDGIQFRVTLLDNCYVFQNIQSKLVADIYAPPSREHLLGLDGNGMDVLARMMYGGRISLLIGFIVVIIEIILGTILGGIAGYFGGVIDKIIMRIVDVFYCIPTMPILIIIGAMFDSQNYPNITRVVWLMVILGFLGWPSIARLVRGQILSIREQDYMIATEAMGLSNRRRIFKHLIPNVMPQLIVQATMGLGSVIIIESTLSFLGLGVKYPMATWGSIINSVSSIQAMVNYTYIWIPVGLLICLAVIAFNFIGDGLRDAFDPKMKR